MAEAQTVTKVITPAFRASYPYLFTPQKDDKGRDNYSVVALFPTGCDLSKLKALASAAVKAKWGDTPPKGLENPLKDQGLKESVGYVPGAMMATLKSGQRPGVVDENLQKIIEPRLLYPGCWCIAQVHAYAWEFKNDKGAVLKRGVSFGLDNVQKVKDDEPIAGVRQDNPEDVFQPVAGATNAAGETAQSADDLWK